MSTVKLYRGGCLDFLPKVPSGSVDCVITDPPYPEIDRDYGRLTESQWHALMDEVVPQCRRILKPTGSAVFVLQPNSERVGRMRPWLWEFMAKWTREWGMVQDAWWWNIAALPLGGSNERGTLRASLKACVWLGSSDCYRNQSAVLWAESQRNAQERTRGRFSVWERPSGVTLDDKRLTARSAERGGVTPFNVLPIPNTNSNSSAGSVGHGAGTPDELCDWWLRYICPDGGTVCDPFIGSGTVGIAAVNRGCNVIGIERMPKYYEVAKRRISEAQKAKAAA